MNKKYRLQLWICAALGWITSMPQAQASADPALLPQFQQQFNQQLQQAKVPGGAYAIVYKDQVLALGSYGVRAVGDNARVNADTVFRLASVSKTFAGNIMVQLSQQGRLDLQQPLKAYVPELQLKTAAIEQKVSVETILSQGSGFWAHAFEDLIEADQTPAQILPRLAELAPVCPPGRCYSYQNVLFGLLGRAAEQSTGQPYETLVSERVFAPLQMHTASYGLTGLLASRNKALPHQRGGKGWRTVKPKANFYRFPAAAGVNASARDLSQYLIAMLGYRPEVFSPALLSQLQQPLVKMPVKPRWPVWQQYRNASAWYGRGWRMVQYGDDKLYYHAGVVDGYRPYIAYSPATGYGLVLLTNAEADVTGKLAGWFWQQVLPGPQLAKHKHGATKKGAR
ncbi:serine hydrolase domain-containing protein [Rheinheimera sp. F8]|uniref:serine hydrolase domain-containing protein n=1 Tax=Rheinheimera sp. F8 TaxID=1763998 RepID=UPI000744C26F|nr:serine hydrolase domain-containing protein [Rheinheimera sp. F8]ALZ75585.1 serine hydrolase [Rheinheimera sp. F8]